MPFDTPTLPALVQRADADLSANADSTLRRSDQVVLSRVHAGATSELHGYLQWAAKQLLPDTCDEDMLLRQAALRLKVPRRAAVASTGPVLLVGQAGSVIDADVLLQLIDGRRYLVTEAVTFAGGQATVPVKAVDAGAAGDVVAGTAISLVSPVLGVASDGVVGPGGIEGGADQESIASLRQRVIESYRLVPNGGSQDDYETWAREADTGVTRVWCKPLYMGPGTVAVFFVRDGDADLIPDAQALARVYDYIETVRPVTAELFVLAPVRVPIPFQIKAYPDNPATRAAIEKSLRDLLLREGDLGVTLPHTHMSDAISQSEGEDDHDLVAPAASIELAVNEIPTFGGIAWL